MQNQKNKYLGISVGTQLMGLALKNEVTLEDWQVKNFEGVWSRVKLRIITLSVLKYVKDNSVRSVALKVPDMKRSSPALELLVKELKRACIGINVEVMTYTIDELKLACGVKNKSEMMQKVLSNHPELSHVFAKTQKVKKVYYVKIFEAVMASMLIS